MATATRTQTPIQETQPRTGGVEILWTRTSTRQLELLYPIQAWDSVTGTRYTWTVKGSLDLSGTGYPGPNSATHTSQWAPAYYP